MVQQEVFRLPVRQELDVALQQAGVGLLPMQQRKVGSAVQLLDDFNLTHGQARVLQAELERLAHPESAPMPASNLPPMQQRAVNSALTLLISDFQIAGPEAGALSRIIGDSLTERHTVPLSASGGVPNLLDEAALFPLRGALLHVPEGAKPQEENEILYGNARTLNEYLSRVDSEYRKQFGVDYADRLCMTIPVFAPNGTQRNFHISNSIYQQMTALTAVAHGHEFLGQEWTMFMADVRGVENRDGSYTATGLMVAGCELVPNSFRYIDPQTPTETRLQPRKFLGLSLGRRKVDVEVGEILGVFLTHGWSERPDLLCDYDVGMANWRMYHWPNWSSSEPDPTAVFFSDGVNLHGYSYNPEVFGGERKKWRPDGTYISQVPTPLTPDFLTQNGVAADAFEKLRLNLPQTVDHRPHVKLAPLVEASSPFVGVVPKRSEVGSEVTYSLPASVYDGLLSLKRMADEAFASVDVNTFVPGQNVQVLSDLGIRRVQWSQSLNFSDGTFVEYDGGERNFSVMLSGSPGVYRVNAGLDGDPTGPVYTYSPEKTNVENEGLALMCREKATLFRGQPKTGTTLHAVFNGPSYFFDYHRGTNSPTYLEMNGMQINSDGSIRFYSYSAGRDYAIVREESSAKP
ncbi:Uncharacterised protein [uncultured archaeon]|nr:Uncharacterised protein [uncultured archaeon]